VTSKVGMPKSWLGRITFDWGVNVMDLVAVVVSITSLAITLVLFTRVQQARDHLGTLVNHAAMNHPQSRQPEISQSKKQ
jgi:Kef-type K+ transport system membrane component KefB